MSGLNEWLEKAEKTCKCGATMSKMDDGYMCKNCGAKMHKAIKETPFHSVDDEHNMAAHRAADKVAAPMDKAVPPELAANAKKVDDAQDPKKPGAEKPDLGAPGKDGGKDDKKPSGFGAEHEMKKGPEGSDKPEEQKDVDAGSDGGEDAPEQETNDEPEEGEGEEVAKGLSAWLSKAAIPGAKDEGEGKPNKGLPSGVQNGLDERKGEGKAEVGRQEDGGKLDGVGTTSGSSDAGMATNQSTTKAASPGKTDQFTTDDPNDTDKMKDELGMIEIPGAPASAYGSMQSMTSRAGRAYGDATKPAEGMGAGSAGKGSSPTVGAPGLNHAKTQGGVGTAAEVKGARAPGAASGALATGAVSSSGGAATSASNPQAGAAGLGHDKSSSKLFQKSSLDGDRTGVVPLEDSGVRDTMRRNAAAQASIRKGEEQIQGFALPADAPVSPQGARPVQVMAKGGAIYTNASDEACMEVLEKGDFYHGTEPGFDISNSFQKSEPCNHCGAAFVKSLTTCPDCGTDRNQGFQKSVASREGGRLQDVRQTHSHGPGLRRANRNPDFFAPDGLVLND